MHFQVGIATELIDRDQLSIAQPDLLQGLA
jgi:hypothetical protein